MTKHLGVEYIGDILQNFAGRTIAITPAVHANGIGLGIAEANEPGYTPVSLYLYKAETYDEAEKEADRINEGYLQLDRKAAAMIITSSMAAGKVNALA